MPACDVVILCAPLTAETKNFVDEEFCRALRPGACLVSVGRGPVVSRDAVLGALERDEELMFASDVGAADVSSALARMPASDYPLWLTSFVRCAASLMDDCTLLAALDGSSQVAQPGRPADGTDHMLALSMGLTVRGDDLENDGRTT